MDERDKRRKDRRDPDVTSLSTEQKEGILGRLHKLGGIFFTPERIEQLIKILGPDTKIKDIQEALNKQENQEPEH